MRPFSRTTNHTFLLQENERDTKGYFPFEKKNTEFGTYIKVTQSLEVSFSDLGYLVAL